MSFQGQYFYEGYTFLCRGKINYQDVIFILKMNIIHHPERFDNLIELIFFLINDILDLLINIHDMQIRFFLKTSLELQNVV